MSTSQIHYFPHSKSPETRINELNNIIRTLHNRLYTTYQRLVRENLDLFQPGFRYYSAEEQEIQQLINTYEAQRAVLIQNRTQHQRSLTKPTSLPNLPDFSTNQPNFPFPNVNNNNLFNSTETNNQLITDPFLQTYDNDSTTITS